MRCTAVPTSAIHTVPGKKEQMKTNGLELREFYPKGMDLSLVDEDELKHNLELMNNRPRKCLGYKTPNEVMNETDSHTSCCT